MDDRELTIQVELATRGDADALQRLIVHHHPTLRRRLNAAVDPAARHRVDADDVLQHAYVSAFQAVGDCQFDGPAGLYKWLERIALNVLRNQQRALRRLKRDIAREAAPRPGVSASCADLVRRLAGSESTPSRRLARSEAVAGVMSCLARLSPDQRAVVRLRFLEGRTVPETAARLSKTDAAVHALCYRALKELRRLLVSLSRYLSRM